MLEHFPYAQTFHLGLFRDKHNFTPTEYYSKLPADLNQRVDIVYLLDPVIATGGTACAAVAMLQGELCLSNANIQVLESIY
jgi:uracil phosphoribosyltransferase